MNVKFTQLGFSLIELMIVIVLFGILAGFAIPSYREFVQNSQIKTAAEGIAAGFQIARGEAVSRNTPVQLEFVGGNSSAWNVCPKPATDGAACAAINVIERRLASEGSSNTITATPTAGMAGPYVFNGFGIMTSTDGGVSASAGAPQIAVDSTDASINSRELRVVIGAGGAVRTCDPGLSASGTDPRRCE